MKIDLGEMTPMSDNRVRVPRLPLKLFAVGRTIEIQDATGLALIKWTGFDASDFPLKQQRIFGRLFVDAANAGEPYMREVMQAICCGKYGGCLRGNNNCDCDDNTQLTKHAYKAIAHAVMTLYAEKRKP